MKLTLALTILVTLASACRYGAEVTPEVAYAGDSKVLSVGIGECFQHWTDSLASVSYVVMSRWSLAKRHMTTRSTTNFRSPATRLGLAKKS